MSLKDRLKKSLRQSVKVNSALGGNFAAVRKINALNTKDKNDATALASSQAAGAAAATAAEQATTQAAATAETDYRAGLSRQKSGLASTILNLGGAAGDPNSPTASGLLGERALPSDGGVPGSATEDPLARLKRKTQAGFYKPQTGL